MPTSARTPANDSSDNLVTIASFATPQEASIARGVLADKGIAACVVDAEIVNTLWYVGTALGGVKLQVAQRDADKAEDLLEQMHSSGGSQSVGPWVCPNCGAEVDAGFEVCWSCGASADSDSNLSDALASREADNASVNQPSADEADRHEREIVPAGDAIAGRAWRAAVFGIGIFPLAFYAFFLSLEALQQELSPEGRRKCYGAMTLGGAMLGLMCFVLVILSLT